MLWWFLIFAFSTAVLLWVGMALYLRVRRHMKGIEPADTQAKH
jgi:hypothetical protein